MATEDATRLAGDGPQPVSGDPLRWPGDPPGRARRRRGVRYGLIGIGLAAYSWFAGMTEPFTRNSLLVVLVPGAVLGVIAYGRPPRRVPAPDRLDLIGTSCWLIAIAAVFEWEASAFRDFTTTWHPSLSDLIKPLMDVHPVKAGAVMTWLLVGWALLRR
jgi:hypothetical protein